MHKAKAKKKAPIIYRRSIFPQRYALYYIVPGTIVLALVTLVPTIFAIATSFTDRSLVTRAAPRFVGIMNYLNILTSRATWRSVYITLIFVVCAVSAELVLGILLALLFQLKMRGKPVLRAIMIMPMVSTPIAMAYLWRLMFSPTNGIINYLLSLVGITGILWNNASSTALLSIIIVDIWQWTPFMFLICTAAITALPVEPFEAAIVDGANFSTIFFRIMLPLISPIISVGLLFRIVDAFKSFDYAFILTGGGPGNSTELLSLRIYNEAFKFFRLGSASAMGFLFVYGVVVICSFIIKRSNLGMNETH